MMPFATTNLQTIQFKKLNQSAVLPKYAHGPEEDAGLDLVSIEDKDIYFGEPVLVKTGLAVAMPPGIEMQIRPRSGLAIKEGITVLNTPGTVDPGYRGEVAVIMIKLRIDQDNAPFKVKAGDRIAQIIFNQYVKVKVEEKEELPESIRGAGGMGSTGVKAA
jgi:dUTP pyrophosphatase